MGRVRGSRWRPISNPGQAALLLLGYLLSFAALSVAVHMLFRFSSAWMEMVLILILPALMFGPPILLFIICMRGMVEHADRRVAWLMVGGVAVLAPCLSYEAYTQAVRPAVWLGDRLVVWSDQGAKDEESGSPPPAARSVPVPEGLAPGRSDLTILDSHWSYGEVHRAVVRRTGQREFPDGWDCVEIRKTTYSCIVGRRQ
jgi:hypothetical protein